MCLVDAGVADRDRHLAGIGHVGVEPANCAEAPLPVVARVGRLDGRKPARRDALGKRDRGRRLDGAQQLRRDLAVVEPHDRQVAVDRFDRVCTRFPLEVVERLAHVLMHADDDAARDVFQPAVRRREERGNVALERHGHPLQRTLPDEYQESVRRSPLSESKR